MSWYRTGTVVVTNGSKTVTGVGTLFTTAVNVGDAFALADANLNPTGAWYEVDVVVSNTEITLKQSYAGTTGSNNQYCVFNMVGNMTTPSFAQRLATFFASFQSLIDKPTVTPTAASIPIADAVGKIDSGWVSDASTTVKGVVKVGNSLSATSGVLSVVPASTTVKGAVELATNAEVITGTDTERAVTPAGLLAGFPTRLRSNLLGTVSQTDGVPTGAVIESGSNANGSYIKLANGTALSYGVGSVTVSGTVEESIYCATVIINYPIEFFGAPRAFASAGYVSGFSFWANVLSSAPNGDTGTAFISINLGKAFANKTVEISVFAIGRWF